MFDVHWKVHFTFPTGELSPLSVLVFFLPSVFLSVGGNSNDSGIQRGFWQFILFSGQKFCVFAICFLATIFWDV